MSITTDLQEEPGVGQVPFLKALIVLPLKLAALLIVGILSLPLWLLYWLGCLVWGVPPNLPRAAQVTRYLRLVWTIQPPAPGITFFGRLWLTLTILQKVISTPIPGLAWLLDELLYGRKLDALHMTAPIFVVSAGRSGSTQISRYIEDDFRLAVPNVLQCMFPYLWLWRLLPRTLGRVITPDKVREKIQTTMPPELLERHETDPFRADTFDGSFYSFHLHRFALFLGPEVAAADFHFARIAPNDKGLKDDVFIALVDRLGRKTLLHDGPASDNTPRRFFIKGHFLFAAEALSRQYTDATFVTVLREPAKRLQSGINYLRVNPTDPALGPVPWAWLSATLTQTESEYCDIEQDWFTRVDGTRRCVIRFAEFVDDLPAAMRRVYKACFDEDTLPAHIPDKHPPRERVNYTVNRSLSELGIDEAKLRERLADYTAWCAK